MRMRDVRQIGQVRLSHSRSQMRQTYLSNLSHVTKPDKTAPARFVLSLIVACAIWLAMCMCVVPASAHAKSHECTSDTIEATVGEDGSLHVVDARTYEFEGRYTLTGAVLDPPPGGAAIVNGVSVIDENGVTTQLVEVPFQGSWRTAGGPASGHYSVDVAENTVYAFSTTEDAKKTFVFDFTYTNAVMQYDDVSVLYWQFVGPNWDVDTEDVNAYVHLPVPPGQSVIGGENVYAQEVEDVLRNHPSIFDCALIGVDDDRFGEAVAAAIVLNPGCTLSDEELIAYCRANLPSYKKPRYVAFVDELPHNVTGKIQKSVLRENADKLFRPVRGL